MSQAPSPRRPRTPRSIVGRLALGTVVLVIAAVVVGGFGLTVVLQRFVRAHVDQRLDLQLAAVTTALQPGADGRLELRGELDTPPFDRPRSGWSWQARTPDRTYTSSSLADTLLTLDTADRHPAPEHDRPRSGAGGMLTGVDVVSRTVTTTIAGHAVTLSATAPLHAVRDPVRQALLPVALTLLAFGLLLGVGSIVQLRIGLRPLVAMRRAVEDVRHGRREHLPPNQPPELAPLVDALNTLLAENAEGLRRARGHVANLGHALKTPLTSLALSLADSPAEALVHRMQQHIRHHLGRARTGATRAAVHVRTPVLPCLDDLVTALQKIYAMRGLRIQRTVDDIAAACEAQDLDEMLGNLLDNACKWAHHRVDISARLDGRLFALTVADDGPGLPPERIPEALTPGRRLDESVPGDGFGLSICRELAELYGGDLTLDRAALGGLAVTLRLPLAR